MKERPILFSRPMVLALMADRKTMTRRLTGLDEINEDPNDWQFEWFDYKVGWCFTQKSTVNTNTLNTGDFNQKIIKCPYGNAVDNDQLFVRENWRPFLRGDGPDGFKRLIQLTADNFEMPVPDDKIEWFDRVEGFGYKQRPCIHHPKFSSRIWLEIEKVKVQRLQDISSIDAIAEGIIKGKTCSGVPKKQVYKNYQHEHFIEDAIESFKSLWISINGLRSWWKNPWVWVVQFRVLSRTGKPKPCNGNCGMNYCDDNGCIDRKRNLAPLTPNPATHV